LRFRLGATLHLRCAAGGTGAVAHLRAALALGLGAARLALRFDLGAALGVHFLLGLRIGAARGGDQCGCRCGGQEFIFHRLHSFLRNASARRSI
jgi:hypothetical protein